MKSYQEIYGNIIALAKSGQYDCVVHGCNCFNTQRAGLAPQMVEAFNTDKFPMELIEKGDINKLGQIDYVTQVLKYDPKYSSINLVEHVLVNSIQSSITVINLYSQYHYGNKFGIPVDYDAIRLGLRKINHKFKGRSILVPKIGAGLAGGNWDIIKNIILQELLEMKVTVVHYKSI